MIAWLFMIFIIVKLESKFLPASDTLYLGSFNPSNTSRIRITTFDNCLSLAETAYLNQNKKQYYTKPHSPNDHILNHVSLRLWVLANVINYMDKHRYVICSEFARSQFPQASPMHLLYYQIFLEEYLIWHWHYIP